jgi:hypothetical protein
MAWITPLVPSTISPQGANAPPAASERRVHENTSTSDRRTGRWPHPSTSRQVEAPGGITDKCFLRAATPARIALGCGA